ncbi:hypothetical protein SCG7086_BJ_00200 [Chlamydiales bacterium SCGC AG-110-P3]|nr:hypothetical protein SCG7086_BJ_00200 [Chlamydiales bacterium SCGC AG-110-P3]
MTAIEQACTTDELVEIEVSDILVNPFQPRREFADESLEELSNSIREVGLIHPPTVRRLTGGGYELIAGERRLRAVQKAGIKRIPVLVRAASDHRSAQAALVEHLKNTLQDDEYFPVLLLLYLLQILSLDFGQNREG